MEQLRVPYELLCDGLGEETTPEIVMEKGKLHSVSDFLQENRQALTAVGITAVGVAVAASAIHSLGHKDQAPIPQTKPLSV